MTTRHRDPTALDVPGADWSPPANQGQPISAPEAGFRILNAIFRRKMARRPFVPIECEGLRYHLRLPDYDQAEHAWNDSKEDEVKQHALLVARGLHVNGQLCFENPITAAITLLQDDPLPSTSVLAICKPILRAWLTNKPIPAATGHGEHPGEEDARAFDARIGAPCRRCGAAASKGCVHRAARVLYRCAEEACMHYVGAENERCEVHR